MNNQLKHKYESYIFYYGYYLAYDTTRMNYIDESDNHITFYMVADTYPDGSTNPDRFIRNGFYSIQIIDSPYQNGIETKSVSVVIKIRKWIMKTSEGRKSLISPVPFLDEKHNATKRCVQQLKNDVTRLPCKELQSLYGVTESYVSMLSKELTKEQVNNLFYLEAPENVTTIYIRKEKLGNTDFYMAFIIDINKKVLYLAEWERTIQKLLSALEKYTSIKIVYVKNDVGIRMLKALVVKSTLNAFDLQYDSSNPDYSPLNIESRNWRQLPRLDYQIVDRVNLLTLDLQLNKLTAKKNLYRIIYGNVKY